MTSKILTIEAAKAANIEVVENGKYTQVVHDVVVALRANRRSGTASVKTKATVSGSGSKPWRQKGTGRARAGYKSSPVWVGGGVVFGPHPHSYAKKVSKTNKRIALRKALSERIKMADVIHVESFASAEAKTKSFLATLTSITTEPKPLVVAEAFTEATYLGARNIQSVLLMTAAEVNTEQMLDYRKVILTQDGLVALSARLAK